MGDCCQQKGCELAQLRKSQSKVLWSVLVINAVMFIVELGGGIRANSLSLTGDSLDMLGDALVYASSLYVLHRSRQAQAQAAFLKGSIMFLSAVIVFARASYELFTRVPPEPKLMTIVGIAALIANLICLWLLTKHRRDNLNMSSVWLCSRNDIIANTSVLGASALVALTGSFIPDFLVGLLITFVFAQSASKVLSQSWRALQAENVEF
ncbi:cation diffusion facilitator family transporter [Crocosphaera chwakensis]|uniref:Cation efflux protein n=1 Tax=Crocosphaera chwakensis CCY0110 TaxID=391612 RepID=A3IS02_9CHRO|nr:cation diffusion facilitator family transporter [Crocosphaera chwakensis]EAZ90680.1 Cation efflux protein [Crocosphaera chwakensis CCY0110]